MRIPTAIGRLAVLAALVAAAGLFWPSPQPAAAEPQFILSVDCDLSASGVQSSCIVPQGTNSITIAVLIETPAPGPLGSFMLDVVNSNKPLLDPPNIPDPAGLDANPNLADPQDFGWTDCSTLMGPPAGETGAFAPAASQSTLGCLGTSIPDTGNLRLATVLYDIDDALTGSADVNISGTTMAAGGIATCFPSGANIHMDCRGATITVTPDHELALDCNPAAAGVQSACVIAKGTTIVNVDWVYTNESGAMSSVGSFELYTHDPDTSRLNPPQVNDPPLQQNSNPDFNQAAFLFGWDCALVPPVANMGIDGPGTAVSRISCFGEGPVVFDGSSKMLASVRYNVLIAPTGGSVTITPEAFVGDNDGAYPVDCIEFGNPAGICAGATLTLPCVIDNADVNNSGQVLVNDLQLVAMRANQLPVDPQYDVTGNGQINVLDLQRQASVYNRLVSECLP